MKPREIKIGQRYNSYEILELGHKKLDSGRSVRTVKVECIHCSNIKTINLQTVLYGECNCYCTTNQKLVKGKKVSPKRYFKNLRKNASRSSRGGVKEFSITLDDILQKLEQQDGKCIYSGMPVSFDDGSLSVDRRDSSIGYTIDNIQIVHRTVNYMKNELPEETFLEFCYAITTNSRFAFLSR